MDPASKTSKILRTKKANRGSKSDSTLEKTSKTSCESTLGRLAQIDLAKFCPKKIFFIFFVVEENDVTANLLKELTEANKIFEELSSLKLISRDEIFHLLDDQGLFPNTLKSLLDNVVENVELSEQNISTSLEVQLLKLKLIQVMYEQYVNEVKRNEKERNLENTLNILSKECKKKQKKEDSPTKLETDDKNKNVPKEDSKKKVKNDKTKENATDEELDYTSIPLQNDGISYEENIFDHIGFYCLTGFYNPSLITELIDLVKVPVFGIVKFSSNHELPAETLQFFWNQIKQMFYYNTSLYKLLESTILMEFKSANKDNIIQTLEKFVFTLRKVVNVLLNYHNYLRNLQINKSKNEYVPTPLPCMYQYEKSMRHIPPECVNAVLILDSVLNEVMNNLEPSCLTTTPSQSLLTKISSKSIRCSDPMYDLNAFSIERRSQGSISTVAKPVNDFLVNAEDVLTKILKSYKNIGPKIADIIENLLKLLPVLQGLNDYGPQVDVLHLHDLNPAHSDNFYQKDESLNNFLYTFLFNKFSHQIKLPNRYPEYQLMQNITAFDINKFFKSCQIETQNEPIDSEDNLYDVSVVHFRWKNKLGRKQLLQEIYKANDAYMYVDRKYSPETDNFLVVFSDKLDEFGTNTKYFNITIRTPICLRDFCRYILIDDASWLKNNLIKIDETTYKPVIDEACLGAQKIKTHLKIFHEYAFLLDENIAEDIDQHIIQVEGEEISLPTTLPDVKSPNFVDIIKDLQNIPSKNSIREECEQSNNSEKLLAYDLGSNIFRLSGKIIRFSSHDCASLTIDNTGFLQLPVKCKFNVSSDDNVLTVFSNESLALSSEPYITSLRLNDDTRLSFIIKKVIPANLLEKHESTTKSSTKEQIEEADIFITTAQSQDDSLNRTNEPEVHDDEIKLPEDPDNKLPLVYCVDEDYIENLLEGKNLDEISTNENYEELIEALVNATEESDEVYKVSQKSNYLKRRNKVLKVPIETAFKNILSFNKIINSELKPYKMYTKRFETPYKTEDKLDRPVDFRVCLPNGLYIRSHSCAVGKQVLMIKQEYSDKKPDIAEVQHEEFRLFSNQGLILIKKINGSITIYKANGDILDFKKTTDASTEVDSTRKCHCSTIDDYRNKLIRLLKDQENCDFTTSRRAHIKSKHNHIYDKKILKLLEEFDVPYIKKSLIKFDGSRIKIQGDKISQKQLYYMTSQQDFFTGEILFERDDDFHSIFEKSGSQKCIFPDGTIISSFITDQLIDDYVFVELSYHYEHPYYATVNFNFDTTFEIHLSNKTILKENSNKDGFFVTMPKCVSVSVTNEEIVFEKGCNNCQGKFKARFDMENFTNRSWKPENKFLLVADSYDKQLSSDYLGNCTRNSSYLNGSINLYKCNHFIKTNYKQCFVINKDLSGIRLHTNDHVRCVMNDLTNTPNAFLETYSNLSSETTVTDCRIKYYRSFADRFYNTIEDLSKYLKRFAGPMYVHYTEFRVFERIYQSADEISSHLANVQEIFFNNALDNMGDTSIASNISKLISVMEVYNRTHQQEVAKDKIVKESRRRRHSREESERKLHLPECACNQEKLTVQEKMIKLKNSCAMYRQIIRNKQIPSYFKSAFCEILK
ncbi:uncharacterized protein LOC126746064 [Anthonomus grandis grandis]|uniref:uncharacterized protein LOC126746064 n=1 Tax=Anthonomus grandis grandis TaxID=2921223 RepID=UPI002165318B|nr:uncharacterized protein LOC126746064 [Anthonomus grandis grandis]